MSFKDLITRIPALFKSDDTLQGYQDRLLGELPNFSGLAMSFGRLERFALQARLLGEARRRRAQRRVNELRANRIAAILGLPPPFPPVPPQLWRITKLREWSARTVKRRTPVPFLEIRVYVYTRKPEDPLYSDGSLLRAVEAVQGELDAFSNPEVRMESFQETFAREEEPVDEDELEEENRRQRRGAADRIIEDDLWYYVAFYRAVAGRIEVSGAYYGRVRRVGGLWVADTPSAAPIKPSFSTTSPVFTPPGA